MEFHVEENVHEGKLRKIEPEKGEPLPEWATPVFVVDQDAKGLLGRLVCAYGVVNAAMELPWVLGHGRMKQPASPSSS